MTRRTATTLATLLLAASLFCAVATAGALRAGRQRHLLYRQRTERMKAAIKHWWWRHGDAVVSFWEVLSSIWVACYLIDRLPARAEMCAWWHWGLLCTAIFLVLAAVFDAIGRTVR